VREIAWLQVSDIHMRQRDEWSQDVVLRAMVDSIRQRRGQGLTLDFILATGDLAFSGKNEEYELVKRFFDELISASGVSKKHIFCVPGNHDVNRDRQTLCFQGARFTLTSSNVVDPVLAPDNEDLATLMQRQEAYRAFQTNYFSDQARIVTPDALAYVSSLTVDDVVIAIVGLNSAWLAEGGNTDHDNLLIGERQIINVFDVAGKLNAHIVIGMAHHPLHLLRDFDRSAATRHITKRCDFYHCGHLHQPESYGSGFDASACLTVAAGASFETRESQNAYSLVKLDLLAGTRTLTTVQYNPRQNSFNLNNEMSFPICLNPAAMCTVVELAEAIKGFDATLVPHSYYLAALLMERKEEVLIPIQGECIFASPAVLQNMEDDGYYRMVEAFLRFRNVLTVLCGRHPLADLFDQHGHAVRAYGADLLTRCQSNAELKGRLAQQDADVRRLFAAQPEVSFVVDWLADLVQSQEWELLAEQARRYLETPDATTQVRVRRMLALALAHSTKDDDRKAAIHEYEILIHDGQAEAQDYANLTILLLNMGHPNEAKSILLEAIAVSSCEELGLLSGVGQQIVGQTGDREFRQQLKAAIIERNGHE
jgi:predicted phosphodiesterase